MNIKTRFPLIAAGAIALIVAIWAGLTRLGTGLPVLQAHHPGIHGPLMVGGFLGVVISLERAAALARGWGYAGPALAAAGVLWLIATPLLLPAVILQVLAAAVLVAVSGALVARHATVYLTVMGLGALAWLAAGAVWLATGSSRAAVLFWAAFPLLTIAGERLELSRVLAPPAWAQRLFWATLAPVGIGLASLPFAPDLGVRLFGLGCLMLAIWLLRFDFATRAFRFSGVHRYTGVCLLTGYLWLAIAGLLALTEGVVVAGFHADAALHALFLGFVFGMIFGHAPIIAPMLVARRLRWTRWYWSHLVLLQIGLLARVAGGLAGVQPLKVWGGVATAVALVLFLGNTVTAGLRGEPLSP